MANRASFADLLTPGFREIYDDKFTEKAMVMDKVFQINTSEKADEKDSSISGFGLAQVTAEGAPVDYEDPVQGYDTTYSHLKYTKGFRITREMYDDDLYGIMRKRPAALGKAMRRTAENLAAAVFNNGFSTSYNGADGKPLFSTVHPRSDGGATQSNASATGLTLSETNLETGRIAIKKQLDEKGQIIDLGADTLLVPVELEKQAHLIIDSVARQGTTDNDMNFYKGTLNILPWQYLTSTTNWFLIDKSENELNWFWRKRPEFKNDDLFDTDIAVYKSAMRLSRGWSDWRGIWASKGDGQAFSN